MQKLTHSKTSEKQLKKFNWDVSRTSEILYGNRNFKDEDEKNLVNTMMMMARKLCIP